LPAPIVNSRDSF